jgi:hypothetical protein
MKKIPYIINDQYWIGLLILNDFLLDPYPDPTFKDVSAPDPATDPVSDP